MPANQTRATKKTTTRRPVSDKPAAVAINFDSWARDEALDPFPIVIGGNRYESLDPMDIDYRDLAAAVDASPDELFRLLFPEDAEEILKHKIPVGAMVAFNEAIVVHFGLEDFIAAQS